MGVAAQSAMPNGRKKRRESASPAATPHAPLAQKFFIGQPHIPYNVSHCNRIDWIVTRDRYDPIPIRHDDMFALARNPETRLRQGTNSVKMIDAGQLRHR